MTPAKPKAKGKPAPAKPPERPATGVPPVMPPLAIGRPHGDRVVVEDAQQAARLHTRATVGELGANGKLTMTLAEAAWLAADGRLAVREGREPLGFAELMARAPAAARAEAAHLAYRDLRERGFVARPAGPGAFTVFPRGASSGEPAFTLQACSDADGVAAAALLDAARAKRVLCVVDADGAVTHYQASVAEPAGDVPEGDLPRAKGSLLADRVLVADAAAAKAYHQREFLGTPHPAGLLLSFVEAEGLRRRGVLALQGQDLEGEAARLLEVHAALRQAGAVPKSGFRFGTHLRAYRGAPDDGHAEWLVHCAAPDEQIPWSLLSRGVRLAHGVRKAFLVAIPDGKAIAFAKLAWFRP
jgi:tRNA-intron endonuclease, archaea type